MNIRSLFGKIFKFLIVIAPLVVALSIFALAKRKKTDKSAILEDLERPRPANVITTRTLSLSPSVYGYGEAVPALVWKAVAEVKGRIVYKNPKLEIGEAIDKGEVMLKIDPEDYELLKEREKDSIQNIEAQISELEVKKSNVAASLAVQKKKLELAKKQYERYQTLHGKKVVSSTDMESQELNMLAQDATVLELENELKLIPARLAALKSQKTLSEHALAQTVLDIERTKIIAPFQGVISSCEVEEGQFVAVGQVLLEMDSEANIEIEAQVPAQKMLAILGTTRPTNPQEQLTATVHWKSSASSLSWPATVQRFSAGVDPQTRTIGVIVNVDNLKNGASSPPILKGMYCEVEIKASRKKRFTVIPRQACKNSYVLITDTDNRLRREKVEIIFASEDYLALSPESLKEGETLLVSDLPYTTEGMLITPVRDDVAINRISELENRL